MAKQASDTLDLVRCRRLVFTATITTEDVQQNDERTADSVNGDFEVEYSAKLRRKSFGNGRANENMRLNHN